MNDNELVKFFMGNDNYYQILENFFGSTGLYWDRVHLEESKFFISNDLVEKTGKQYSDKEIYILSPRGIKIYKFIKDFLDL